MRASAPAKVEMSLGLALASPPAATISATTCSAGVRDSPSGAGPTSLTTTLAPSAARNIASPRPMPPPEPVTIATLPSSAPMVPPGAQAGDPADVSGAGVADAGVRLR